MYTNTHTHTHTLIKNVRTYCTSPPVLDSRSTLFCADVNATQPSFTHSVGGYSSYLALPLSSPGWVSSGFDAQFHLSSPDPDQIALLFFVGGRNGGGGVVDTFSPPAAHGLGDSYLAVSYVKGHVLLTWDLGEGDFHNREISIKGCLTNILN